MSDENQEVDKEVMELLHKYDNLITFIDYKNPLYYGALFKQLYSDFKTDTCEGKIDKSIDDLGKLIEKACAKLNFDIHNASIKQLIKLYDILVEKLNGSKTLRNYDLNILEPLLHLMYTDDEILEILYELEEKKINPENIVGINRNNEIVFSNKKLIPLRPSKKNDELMNYLAEKNSNIKKKDK